MIDRQRAANSVERLRRLRERWDDPERLRHVVEWAGYRMEDLDD